MSLRAKAWLCLAALFLILAFPVFHAWETCDDHSHHAEECPVCQAILAAQGPAVPARPAAEAPVPVLSLRFSPLTRVDRLSCADRFFFPPRGPPVSLLV